jgi:hypothetical protein
MSKFIKTRQLLEQGPLPGLERHDIAWSDAYKGKLEVIALGQGAVRTPLDISLAPVFLRYCNGDAQGADEQLHEIATKNLDSLASDHEGFITLAFALFVAQKFDILAALLGERYGFTHPLELAAGNPGPGQSRILWTIDDQKRHRFAFDPQAFKSDKTRTDILGFVWLMPLLTHYANSTDVETGKVIINTADMGSTPGLAYCDNRPDYFLIPDCIFVPSRGYAYHRSQAMEHPVPWERRRPVAMWRGATTGIPTRPGDWRSLERVRLCQMARSCSCPDFFDVGLSSVIQFPNPAIVDEIKSSGLMAPFIPALQWNEFKYLIDIDGNSSPWSNLFQRLLTGSTVLKVESSRGLQQWYYDSLKPWVNYVPISCSLTDLADKVAWLRRHDNVAQAIGEAGRQLAMTLSYERELDRAVPVITAALKYFKGDLSEVAPFGRVDGNGLPRPA